MPIKFQQLTAKVEKIWTRQNVIFKDNSLWLGSEKPVKCGQDTSATAKIVRLQ
jgi:hypothetical protein